MYHTHEATVLHDKVYALLGMSSDDPSDSGLSPDYKVSWEELFQRLVKFLLGRQVSVKTWAGTDMAVIKSKGCILGEVSLISDDREHVDITSKNAAWYLGDKRKWTLQTSAKSILKGDFVCLLQGAPKPTIIRPCTDYFAVVMIAVTPLNNVEMETGSVGRPELSKSLTHFPRDFLLVWDWEKSPGKLQDREEYETLIKTRVPEHSKAEIGDHSDKATRLSDAALVLEDLEEYEKAVERLRGVVEHCKEAFGQEHPHTLTRMDKLALMYKNCRQWKEAEELFKQVIQIRKQKLGTDHPETLSSMATLASVYRDQGHLKEAEELEMRVNVLKLTKDDPKIAEVLIQIASLFDAKVMTLLLGRIGADVNAQGGEYGNALQAAVVRDHEEIVELLLGKGADVNAQGGYYGNALQAAAYQGYGKIVELLLGKGADVNAQGGYYGNALQAAAYQGYGKIVELLLGKGADINAEGGYYGNALQAAAYRGHEEIIELLLSKGADINAQGGYYGNALQAAVNNDNDLCRKHILDTRLSNAALMIQRNWRSRRQLKQRRNYLKKVVIIQNLWRGKKARQAYKALREEARDLKQISYKLENKVVELTQALGTMKKENVALVNQIESYEGQLKSWKTRHNQLKTRSKELQAEANQGNKKIVELLLSKGADINAQGGFYGNALQAAAYRGHEKIVELLLSKGADVNAQGGYYGNALQAADMRLSNAALMIQRNWRSRRQLTQWRDYRKKVVIIQNLWRGKKARQAYKALREEARDLKQFSYKLENKVMELTQTLGAMKKENVALLNQMKSYEGQLKLWKTQHNQLETRLKELQAEAHQGNEKIVELLSKGADINAQGGYYGNRYRRSHTR